MFQAIVFRGGRIALQHMLWCTFSAQLRRSLNYQSNLRFFWPYLISKSSAISPKRIHLQSCHECHAFGFRDFQGFRVCQVSPWQEAGNLETCQGWGSMQSDCKNWGVCFQNRQKLLLKLVPSPNSQTRGLTVNINPESTLLSTRMAHSTQLDIKHRV